MGTGCGCLVGATIGTLVGSCDGAVRVGAGECRGVESSDGGFESSESSVVSSDVGAGDCGVGTGAELAVGPGEKGGVGAGVS